MADRHLMQLAAQCYREAGAAADAARCYVEADDPLHALDIFVEKQMFPQAAELYLRCGPVDHAGWLLADRVGDIPAARAIVDQHADLTEREFTADDLNLAGQIQEARDRKEEAIDAQDFERAAQARDLEKQLLARQRDVPRKVGGTLRWRLVLARCDAAERVAAGRCLRLLGDVQRALAGLSDLDTQPVEEWAVSVATTMRRLDQAALVFAASVRGRRRDAARRWRQWSVQTLGEELVLPPGVLEGGDR